MTYARGLGPNMFTTFFNIKTQVKQRPGVNAAFEKGVPLGNGQNTVHVSWNLNATLHVPNATLPQTICVTTGNSGQQTVRRQNNMEIYFDGQQSVHRQNKSPC